jgi:hypothetical protein
MVILESKPVSGSSVYEMTSTTFRDITVPMAHAELQKKDWPPATLVYSKKWARFKPNLSPRDEAGKLVL